jgi:hypothetical protein
MPGESGAPSGAETIGRLGQRSGRVQVSERRLHPLPAVDLHDLAWRNSVYHAARVVTEAEARALVDRARRFVERASGVVDTALG